MFSNRFLDSLGAWQNGWREDKVRRETIAAELRAAVAAEGLAAQFLTCPDTCYRKRFLVPSNPENGGDFGALFLNGVIEEGPAAWTTDEQFARTFKNPLRAGTQSAIFAHVPQDDEVILNVPELWRDLVFVARVEEYERTGGKFAAAIKHFAFNQSEIIMDADLQLSEVYAFCGQSSTFDELCDMQGITSEEEKDRFWEAFSEKNIYPRDPYWLKGPGVRNALERTKEMFLATHGDKLKAAIQARKGT